MCMYYATLGINVEDIVYPTQGQKSIDTLSECDSVDFGEIPLVEFIFLVLVAGYFPATEIEKMESAEGVFQGAFWDFQRNRFYDHLQMVDV